MSQEEVRKGPGWRSSGSRNEKELDTGDVKDIKVEGMTAEGMQALECQWPGLRPLRD